MINLKQASNELKGGGSSIPAGIHNNVELVKLEQGDDYLDFFLKDEFGREKKDRIYDPSEAYTYKRDDETKEEAFQRETDEKAKQLLQYIVGTTDVELPDQIGSYAELRKLAVQALAKPVHKLNVKLIPDKKEPTWSNFPRFAPYVERSQEGVPPTLRYTKYELKLFEPKGNQTPSENDKNYSLF